MTIQAPQYTLNEYKDRSTWLVVFGIIEIIIGALFIFSSLSNLMLLTGISDTQGLDTPSSSLIISFLFTIAIAALFITLGIGSIKAKRWARTLTYITSWLWLLIGIIGFIFAVIIAPGLMEQIAESSEFEDIPEGFLDFITYLTLAFIAIFYVVLPALFVWFYGNKNVVATCERKDPKENWTDRCPQNILAISLAFTVSAFAVLSAGTYGWTVPFFGIILSGGVGAAVVIVSSLFLGYTALGLYKLDVKAWWYAVVLTFAWSISFIITYPRYSLSDFYEKMNLSTEQIEVIDNISVLDGPIIVIITGLVGILFIGYMFRIKKQFQTGTVQEYAE